MTDSPPGHVARRGVRRGVYVIPALFTLGNVFCGFLALDAAVAGEFYRAATLLFFAGVLDGLDGRVARLTNATSAFGEQLDSLADVVSFGVAPAFVAYRWGLLEFERVGIAVAFLFVVCGACRLARFNVQLGTTDKRWFVGLPIPAGAGAVVGIIWAHPEPLPSVTWKVGYLVLVFLVAFLMVSTFRFRSFKDVDLRSRRSIFFVPVFAAIIAAVAWRPEISLTVLGLVYAASAPFARLFSLVSQKRPAETAT